VTGIYRTPAGEHFPPRAPDIPTYPHVAFVFPCGTRRITRVHSQRLVVEKYVERKFTDYMNQETKVGHWATEVDYDAKTAKETLAIFERSVYSDSADPTSYKSTIQTFEILNVLLENR
jgi:hypothetical protein